MDSGLRLAPGLKTSGGAFASALLLALALPPFALFPLPFLALVPLALALRSLPAGPAGRWQATEAGGLFGVAFWGLALVWVPLIVGRSYSWAYPGYLLLLLILAGLSGLMGWMTHQLHHERKLPFALALALAWVGVEWAKGHFPFGLAFPWLGLGVTLSGWPELLGVAEWVGEAGVSFWLACVNGLVALAILGQGRGRGVKPWLLLAGVGLLPAVMGVARARSIRLVDGPTVAVVGTDVPPGPRGDPDAGGVEALNQIQRAVRSFEPGTLDLLVFPEGILPFAPGESEAREFLGALQDIASTLRAPVLFGALGGGASPDLDGAPTNSAYLLLPGGGELQRYDKVRLVPGMEAGSYRRGSVGGTLGTPKLTVGPLICYESLFGELSRGSRRAGAQLLVNLSSDIWFGGWGTLVGDAFLTQHPAHLVLRAVENRMPVARAANGGVSFLLDPLGQVIAEAEPPVGGWARARLPFSPGVTLFSRIGDWVGPGSALFCLLLVVFRGRRGWAGRG
jgi:apolipoprotein N-acyltransferase